MPGPDQPTESDVPTEPHEPGALTLPTEPDETAAPEEETDEETRRRRRAAVFGDVLPESTSDERADWGDRGARGSEEWLRAQVPPHHG